MIAIPTAIIKNDEMAATIPSLYTKNFFVAFCAFGYFGRIFRLHSFKENYSSSKRKATAC